MKKVVILGAGLATRLYPITSHIPKVLVNYKQHTILKHLYDLYKSYGAEEIIVVVNSRFKQLVEEYSAMMNLEVIVRCVDEPYGSMHAINRIYPDISGHNVIFNWCDVVPEFGRSGLTWNENTIYVHGNECRYKFDNDKKAIVNVGQSGGDIVGIYQLANYTANYPESVVYEKDFVEFLYAKDFKSQYVPFLVDIGDIPKLRKAHAVKELNREFNEITINNNVVLKKALNEKGLKLQKEELNWYDSVKSNSVPDILIKEQNFFTMERIFGKPMFEAFDLELLPKILDGLRFSDEVYVPTKLDCITDVKKEAYDKVIDRCDTIRGMFDSFGVKYVNGTKIGHLKSLLRKALPYLTNNALLSKYTVIHGDPNFSNTMLSDDNEVKFIDPRGYFGDTKIYGPRIYDEAKVLYALSGYDEFNSDPLWAGLSIEGDSAVININPLIENYCDQDFVTFEHKLWLAIIWIALGGYFKNNPLKACSAYFYGMHLLTETLKGVPRISANGLELEDLETPITASVITKCPSKWILIDTETNQKYKMKSTQQDVTKQWELL